MAENAYGGFFLVSQSYRDPFDFEVLLQGDVDQFHIKGETVEPGMPEDKVGNFSFEPFDAALGVEIVGSYDRPDEVGEKGACDPAEFRDFKKVG